MRMRLIIFVVLLTAMTSGVADAEWTLVEQHDAKPQPFQVFDDYVIAVGTEETLEVVQASDIKKALQDSKEIRLRYTEVQGNFAFHNKIKRSVHCRSTAFSGNSDLSFAKFSGDADFWYAKFLEGVSFAVAKFSGKVDFRNCCFKDKSNFTKILYPKNE